MSKFLESFKGKWINIYLYDHGELVASGYLIDEDEEYYYIGSKSILEVTQALKKDPIINVSTNTTYFYLPAAEE